MSEYWKSTPKYWCKFCEAFVKDTKFEKQQHDATPRHQGNIQRSLRRLHKDNEREERDKDRAKAEVARLNGIVSGSGGSSGYAPAHSVAAPTQKATADDRKRQLKQLADLGVAVPEAYRREVAMAGDWETISVRQIKKEEDVKPDVLSFGTHKRKFEGQEEEEEAGTTVVRKGWGSTTKRYPGSGGAVDDIESLLRSGSGGAVTETEDVPQIKKEETDEAPAPEADASTTAATEAEVKQEEDAPAQARVVFKKRKAKVMK